jgi:hypothetical protein
MECFVMMILLLMPVQLNVMRPKEKYHVQSTRMFLVANQKLRAYPVRKTLKANTAQAIPFVKNDANLMNFFVTEVSILEDASFLIVVCQGDEIMMATCVPVNAHQHAPMMNTFARVPYKEQGAEENLFVLRKRLMQMAWNVH